MAREIHDRDLKHLLSAAQRWIERCLCLDKSLLTDRSLWTLPLIEELRAAFVDHPDAGEDNFMTKLQGQMQVASPAGCQLMAEMMWALLLFPSNIGPDKKRQHVQAIWSWSTETLPPDNSMFDSEVLEGVGSAGTAFNNLRWKELAYLITLAQSIKSKSAADRSAIFENYERFMEWIDSVPRDGDRQFRHMLRYFAFPDQVERMSSNRDRVSVLEGFKVAPRSLLKGWTDRQLDDSLLKLRRDWEAKYPGEALDFYKQPLEAMWRSVEQGGQIPVPAVQETMAAEFSDQNVFPAAYPHVAAPINLVVYGPPGTGKTHWLQSRFKDYTDAPSNVDPESWLQETLTTHGWRSVIAAALADVGRPARVPEIRAHRWVQAKAKQRGRAPASVQATLWGYLQEHTPETSKTVKISIRRPPYLFDKRESGEWQLISGWEEQDDESAQLWRTLKAGPKAATEAIHRYKVVTFHPSFTYEDFVRGIRPVRTAADGTTQFRLVDGKFKQICDEAHGNPGKRYALFIDEINRANIAKVFGELITLIEPDKRAVFDAQGRLVEGLAVHLPGEEEADTAERPFGVPKNLDIYGTMNTADRSIALLDVALRRRFQFEERGPDYKTLATVVDGVKIDQLLKRINDRLEYLLDRDHRIGHAYLMKAQTLDNVREAFAKQLIPLLQEYFFDDFSRVALVLSTTGDQAFIKEEPLRFDRLFARQQVDGVQGDRSRFIVTSPVSWAASSFRGIYEDAAGVAPTV